MGKSRIIIMIIAATIHSAAFFAIAGVDEGVAAYKRGDYTDAFKEFEISANQGNAEAQFNLGVMYARGDGVPKDYMLAYMWFDLAAAQGHNKARKNRDVSATQLTLKEIAEARALAEAWKPSKQ